MVLGLTGLVLPLFDDFWTRPVNGLAGALGGTRPFDADAYRRAGEVLALSAWYAVLLATFAFVLLFLLARRASADTSAPATWTVDQVAAELVRALDTTTRVTVVGYSLTFAEPVRLALEAGGRRALTVHLGVPTDAYLLAHVEEGRPMQRRVDRLNDRVDEWRELKTNSRVDDVVVVRQDVPPHLFAIGFGDTLFVGRYPFVHQAGRHVLRKSQDRSMVRVDQAASPVLSDLLRQQVECRTV